MIIIMTEYQTLIDEECRSDISAEDIIKYFDFPYFVINHEDPDFRTDLLNMLGDASHPYECKGNFSHNMDGVYIFVRYHMERTFNQHINLHIDFNMNYSHNPTGMGDSNYNINVSVPNYRQMIMAKYNRFKDKYPHLRDDPFRADVQQYNATQTGEPNSISTFVNEVQYGYYVDRGQEITSYI